MPRGEPTRSVPVRLTDRQRAECEEAAAAARLTLTGWMRAVAVEAARERKAGVEASSGSGPPEPAVSAVPPRAESRSASPPDQPRPRRTVKPPPMTVGRAVAETAAFIRAGRVRPAHAPTCKCPVCRPPKPAK